MKIVECETLYREVYYMTDQEYADLDFSDAETINIEAIDIPTVISVKDADYE